MLPGVKPAVLRFLYVFKLLENTAELRRQTPGKPPDSVGGSAFDRAPFPSLAGVARNRFIKGHLDCQTTRPTYWEIFCGVFDQCGDWFQAQLLTSRQLLKIHSV